MPKKAIRNLGCESIDFVGRHERNNPKDKRIVHEIIEKVADKRYIPRNWDKKISSYCESRNWLPELSEPTQCNVKNIPFLDMVLVPEGDEFVIQKQYVLGRMSNLKDYYKCEQMFYSLNSDDWDFMYQLNDLFVYCAQNSLENDFPIRIITDLKRGIHSKDKKTGLSGYQILLTIPHLLKGHEKIDILSRELCQITHYFDMHLFQSKDYPHIFFASKHSPKKLKDKINKYHLREVILS
jgi:hypothetical protein